MEWARHSQQDSLFLKIDSENVYDKIEWYLILTMLKALRFSPIFVQTVHMLFQDASAMLTLNNVQSESIGWLGKHVIFLNFQGLWVSSNATGKAQLSMLSG